jgi:hypothetical protein
VRRQQHARIGGDGEPAQYPDELPNLGAVIADCTLAGEERNVA